MPIDTSIKNISRLTEIHLRRYEDMRRRAEAGDRNLRLDELQDLLVIWTGIASRGFKWDALTDQQRGEIGDAIYADE